MAIPEEINGLIKTLNGEIAQIERKTQLGVNLVRPLIARFPDNLRLIRFFSLFNNVMLFVELSQKRIQATIEQLSLPDVTPEDIQNAGEELGLLFGRLTEVKIEIEQVVDILEGLS